MKNYLVFVAFLFFINMNVYAESLAVKVTGIDNELGGNLIVLIFGEDGFPMRHEKSLLAQSKKVTNETMTFIFEAPGEEYIAIKVLHDNDANNKVTKNWTGIWPREGLGFSNGGKIGTFGPPGFEGAKISRETALKGVKIDIDYP